MEITQVDKVKDKFVEALEFNLGILSHACKAVGISRTTYYNWIKEDKDFKDRCENITELTIDFVESKLYELIRDGNAAATIFYLKTKAKHRGYIQSQHTHITGDKTNINILSVDPLAIGSSNQDQDNTNLIEAEQVDDDDG